MHLHLEPPLYLFISVVFPWQWWLVSLVFLDFRATLFSFQWCSPSFPEVEFVGKKKNLSSKQMMTCNSWWQHDNQKTKKQIQRLRGWSDLHYKFQVQIAPCIASLSCDATVPQVTHSGWWLPGHLPRSSEVCLRSAGSWVSGSHRGPLTAGVTCSGVRCFSISFIFFPNL